MRLGRVPLLGIDYGSTPGSFSSNEANRYAKEGNHAHAALAEMLCDLYKDRPDISDGLFHSWELKVNALSFGFGETREEALELIRAECDPDYTRNENVEPELEYVQPEQEASYRSPLPTYHQAPAAISPAPSMYPQIQTYPVSPSRIYSGFSWNQMLSPFGSMWT